jgi:enoyl-CoA hydratase
MLTLNRPAKRNALTASLIGAIGATIQEADADPEVRAMVLTGADPAFCAGLDLHHLESVLAGSRLLSDREAAPGLMPKHTTPIVGAINGPAVTGGLELALGCDFLVASTLASFADTHARVGVMPSGGMTIRLPQLIGIDRARRMSLTGDFVDAATALQWGLVTEVVAPDHLVPRARALASTIAGMAPGPVTQLRHMYAEVGAVLGDEAVAAERHLARDWTRENFTQSDLSARADAIIARGSEQVG